MNLEQVIRSTLSESGDMEGRLDQLVRAGLMPSNILPVLKRAIAKMHNGMTLQGAERDAMNMFINSMMFIVLGDDTVFNKARAGAKGYAAEETEIEEASTYEKNKQYIEVTHQLGTKKRVPVHPLNAYKALNRYRNDPTTKSARIVSEAKEKQEYDYEGDMAMSQLKSIIANSQRMHDSMSEDTNLPEWVQSKITLAEDYISTAANYLQGEVSEAVGDYTVKKVSAADAYKKHTGQMTKKNKVPADPKTGKTLYQKVTSEEVEQVDEISKATLGSYVKKASGAEQPKNVMSPKNVPLTKIAAYQGDSETGHFGKRFNQHTYDKAERLRKNRETGIKRAVDKLAKEEVEQVDEISKAMAGRYVKKAAASIDLTAWRQGHKEAGAGNPSKHLEKKLSKRHKGIETAVKKLTREESENLDELSKDTMGRYINKAATKMGSQGVTAGLKIAADEKSSKNFKDMGKREKGIKLAVKKLTKESRKTDAQADIAAIKQMNESYKTTFDAALQEFGIKSPSELDEEKRKEFFNFVDQNYKKGDN